jgi:uncharacterized membrane protein YgaE (UPF0421/DUF939 family)
MARRWRNVPASFWARLPELLSPERRRELVEGASVGVGADGRFARLRAGAWPLLQIAVAAALAWLLAAKVLGHPDAYFAPLAAIIALAATRGQRVRQAVEMVLGVAVGIGVGDLLVRGIGIGTWQLALIVALALATALILGPGRMLSIEAAVSAALVATVSPQTQGFPPTRFLDALVGGAVALVFSQLLFPVHPVKVVRETLESILSRLAATLEDVADSLERRDLDAAHETLRRAREINAAWSEVEHALDAGREAARFSPKGRRVRGRFADVQDVGLPLDLTVRDARPLARNAVRALTIGENVPDGIPAAIRDLACGARELAEEFAGGHDEGDVQAAALRATRRATEVLPSQEQLSTSLLVGQVQATSADMLRSLGVDRERAHAMVGEEAVRAAGDESSDDGSSPAP